MNKKMLTLGILFLFLITSLVVGCGGDKKTDSAKPAAAVQTKVLKLSHTDGPTGARQAASELFAKKVSEYTKGRYKIEVYHSGQLANDQKGLEQVALGGIDFAIAGNIVYSNIVKEYNLTSLPYLIDTYEQGWHFYDDSKFMQDMNKKFEPKGMKIVSVFEAGFRSFTTKKPFNTLADVKNAKMRIFNNDFVLWITQSMGMNPVAMPVTEAYLGIQQGVVEGQENPVDTIYSQKFYEVAPYITLTEHQYAPIPLSVSMKTWKALSPEDQEAVMKAGKEASMFSRETVRANDNKLLEEMKSKGAKVNMIDKAPLQAATKSVYEKASGVYTKELVDSVIKEAEAIKAKYPVKK